MTVYQGLQYGDSTNLAGLREDIYYLGKVNSSFISANDLNRIINKYYAQIQEVIRSVNENFYMVEATADLVIGDGTYTYPNGNGTAPTYEKIKSIFAAYRPANIASPLATEYEKVNCIDPIQVSDPSYIFTQPTALLFGTYFVLMPLVTDTTLYPVTGGIKMYYIATQNKLVNDTDMPLIFPSFHDSIVHGSLIDVAQRRGDMQLKKDSLELFTKRIEDIKNYASDHLPQEIGVVEGQENQGGWIYPWGNNNANGM